MRAGSVIEKTGSLNSSIMGPSGRIYPKIVGVTLTNPMMSYNQSIVGGMMIDTNNFLGNKDKLRTSTLVSAQGTRTVKTATGSVLSSVKSGDDGYK